MLLCVTDEDKVISLVDSSAEDPFFNALQVLLHLLHPLHTSVCLHLTTGILPMGL